MQDSDWISNFTNLTSVKISGCNDYEPINGKVYFSLNKEIEIDSYVKPTLHKDKRDLPVIIIGISFYNENAIELRRTLISLADQVKSLGKKHHNLLRFYETFVITPFLAISLFSISII